MTASLRIFIFACVILVVAAGVNLTVFAQEEVEIISQESAEGVVEQQPSAEEVAAELENEQQVQKTFEASKPLFNPQSYNSLFFTTWEMENIERMRRIANSTDSGMTRVPVDALEGQE
ncbi:MAG: hypothetical protein JKY71_05040, partial [Alphaproteobacteria bacterium]|nr:hypothetical protein [Alphaproteobacteria bacterium]